LFEVLGELGEVEKAHFTDFLLLLLIVLGKYLQTD
jgi:hypothetical protein